MRWHYADLRSHVIAECHAKVHHDRAIMSEFRKPNNTFTVYCVSVPACVSVLVTVCVSAHWMCLRMACRHGHLLAFMPLQWWLLLIRQIDLRAGADGHAISLSGTSRQGSMINLSTTSGAFNMLA